MTEQEAINYLRLEGIEVKGNPRRLAEFFDGLDVAITALEEIQEYRVIGTVEECRSAMKNKMELPCAVGDDVWYISKRVERKGRKKMEVPFVDHGVVDNITLGHMMIPQITVCNDVNVWTTFDGVEDFCKIVFLTKEEAEATLKELEGKEE